MCEERQRLQDAGIFFGGHHERAATAGPVRNPAFGPSVHRRAYPVPVAAQAVAAQHERRTKRLRITAVRCADPLQCCIVGKRCRSGQLIGPTRESGIEFIGFLAVHRDGSGRGRCERRGSAERDNPDRPRRRHVARVDLEAEVGVHDPVRPRCGADGRRIGIDAGDSGHDPIRVREIEARIGTERHRRGGATLGAFARHDPEHSARGVIPQVPIPLWKR